eukprot:TRINITY_DN483_c0_g1_i3.p1 TRINITY_DN483_c0_g1~~TRINITY_DN483_c0_g1_i3.p1  ORF type:complete len:224 (+),score=54.19 TRINITY_DN483_c0_g1_i3:66-737(+)
MCIRDRNIPLQRNGFPTLAEGELLLLERNHVEIKVKIPTLKPIQTKGKLYLTTTKLVFVSKGNHSLNSFDIPLASLREEKFIQPLFGDDYLRGKVIPVFNVIPGYIEFKLWFQKGNASKVLYLLGSILQQIRSRPGGELDERFLHLVKQRSFTIDVMARMRDDPSIVFVHQSLYQQRQEKNLKQEAIQTTTPLFVGVPEKALSLPIDSPQNQTFVIVVHTQRK